MKDTVTRITFFVGGAWGGAGGLKGPILFLWKLFGEGCPGQELSHFSVYQVLPKLCRWFLKKKEKKKEMCASCWRARSFVV